MKSGWLAAVAVMTACVPVGFSTEESGLHMSDVSMSADGYLGLTFDYTEDLVGSVWAVYVCDVTDVGALGSWERLGESLVLGHDLQTTWEDGTEVRECTARLYLLRRVVDADHGHAPEALVLRARAAPDAQDVVQVDVLDPDEVARLFAVGFDSSEGFTPGSLDEQHHWTCVGEVVIQQDRVKAGDQAVVLRGKEARMTRKVISEGGTKATIEMSVYIDSKAGLQTTGITMPKRTSASISFHPKRGFFAYDGNGEGGGAWKLVPDSLFLDQWVQVVIENDYEAKTWDITIQDQGRLVGLGFRNNDLEHIEEINLYAGNNKEMLIDSIRVVEE